MNNENRRVPSVGAQALMFIATGLAMLGNYYVYDSIGPVAELLTRQLGFSDAQLGSLNAIYSLPNVFLVLVGGVLVDRLGARLVVFWTTAICLAGAVLTQLGAQFPVMVLGAWAVGPGVARTITSPTPNIDTLSNTAALGHVLYTRYVYYFQAAGLVLLVAMIGAIVLTLRHKPNVKRQNVGDQVARTKATAIEIRHVRPGQGI